MSSVKLDKFLRELDPKYPVAFDTETTSLKFYNGRIFGFSIAQLKPKPKKLFFRIDDCDKEKWFLPLKIWLADPKYKKKWFNGKFDWQFLKNEGIEVINNHEDVQIKAFLCNENQPSFALFKLCEKYLGYKDPQVLASIEYEVKLKEYLKKIKSNNYADVPKKLMNDYAIGDGILTLRLDEYLDSNLWDDAFQDVYNVENQMLEILTEMEYEGVDIDVEYLKQLQDSYLDRRNEVLMEIYNMNLYKFESIEHIEKTLNSSKQLGELLYDIFKLRNEEGKPNYTKAGRYSTDDAALKSLLKVNSKNKFGKFLELKKKYTSVTYSLNTFIDPYLATSLQYGKVYPSYNQTVARTGRLTCWEPNMQNLPKKDETGGDEIRRIIVNPNPKNLDLGDADYSQVELRLLAHYTKDPDMIEGFKKGFDFHTWTAEQLGISRRDAKDVNFAIWYGIGVKGLAIKLEKSESYARKFKNNYFEKFPRVKLLMSQCMNTIKRRGWVKSYYGRRFRVPVEKAYIATNRVIQGTAGDVLKRAMIRLKLELGKDIRFKAQIHDEILYLKEKGKHDKLIRDAMSDPDTFRVPLTIDMKNFETNWGVTNGKDVIF